MGGPRDVEFGRLALARGLLRPEVLRQVYGQLPPGRSLAGELVARGLLPAGEAQALMRELETPATLAPPAARAFVVPATPRNRSARVSPAVRS